jgi:hypothetical protein
MSIKSERKSSSWEPKTLLSRTVLILLILVGIICILYILFIARPSVEKSVNALASDTSIPMYTREGASVDGLEIILADSHVRNLVKYAMINKQNWKEVVEHIVPIIHDYAYHHDPKGVTSISDSYTKGWRTGYDRLIVVLAAIGYAGSLPDILMSYEAHQAEINNSVGKINPDHGRWEPVDIGHNCCFFLYMDRALHLFASDEKYEDHPPSAKAVAEEFVASCDEASRQSYRIEGYDLTIQNDYTAEANPYDFALRFWQATEDTGYLRGHLKRRFVVNK